MDVVSITYPKEQFSRFTFFDQKSSELQLRYKILINKTAKQILQPIRFVRLYLCKSSRSKKFPIEISDLLENWETDKEEIGETIKYDSFKSFVKCQSGFENSIALLLVDSNSKLDFVNLVTQNVHIILIEHDDDAKGKRKVKDEDKLKITTAKKGDISTKVNYLLERSSLAPLKKIAEDCYGSLVKDRNDLSADSAEDLPSLKSVIVSNKFRKVETETGVRSATPSTSYQNGFVFDRQIDQTNGRKRLNTIYPLAESRSKFQTLRKSKTGIRKKTTEPHQVDSLDVKCRSMDHDHVDTAESLLEAILALYRMVKVPDTDRPNVPSQSYTICNELQNELFKICPSIKRMGYRYRTFTIYAAKPERYDDEVKRNSRIESVLKGYGIDTFKLVPCADDIIPLTYVGAEIEARSITVRCLRSRNIYTEGEVKRGGTLGCIVSTSDARQCGLLSKHVSEDCSVVYYVNENHNERFGTILQETNKNLKKSLDISAALMNENVDDNRRKFKNIQGLEVLGKLYHYKENQEDAIFGMGQSVYIRGASSNPGKGEITMPFVHVGLSTPHIQVEDALSPNGTVQKPFAKKGDSGAVVCADVPGNYAHAVGMVKCTYNIESETTRRKYLALPLSKGIEQLQDETGTTLSL